LGGPADIATADGYAQRAMEMAAELHFPEFELHGHCLQARFARLTGRIDDAQRYIAAARRIEVPDDTGVAVLTKGIGFLVDLAVDLTTPAPSADFLPDPVAWIGWLAASEGLLLAGRIDEAEALLADDRTLPGMSSIEGMSRGLLRGIVLTATGRLAEARPFAEHAVESAAAVRARAAEQAATALLAEIEALTGNASAGAALLAEAGATSPDSVTGVLALRARVALGEDDARDALVAAVERLAAPGLLIGSG
jgi:hypothetical protein